MGTIFKVGMKVYDQMFFPDVEGKIIKVHDKYDKIQLEVKFFSKYRLEPLCMQSSVFYTENGNMINFLGYNCGTSTLSTSPYKLEMQGFEQKAPAPTIEDALDWFNSDEFKNLSSPNKSSIDKINEQLKALKELLVLRDYYNKGEVFDRVDFHGGEVYSIRLEDAGSPHFEIVKVCNAEYPFTFWDKDTAEKFMSEQSFLLSIAKSLL